jgi:3-oxoisoapionate decarboxylase
MWLAYTCFAVRMLQGRDILKSTAAALDAFTFLDLCARFGAEGAQLDWSQLESLDANGLASLARRIEDRSLGAELSVPSAMLETSERYQEVARVARILGVTRIRVALVYGRRYESFQSRTEWIDWWMRWRATLTAMRPTFEDHDILIGIENHKDLRAVELAELLHEIESPRVGACVDVGNNIALLETPLETVETLAPFTVTTHLKDMATQRCEAGFALSEVPLGEGCVPVTTVVERLRAARPDVHLCLEMITRDPLMVPYRTDRYWVAMDRPSPESLARFEHDILDRSWSRPLPSITGLSPEDQIAAEDEHVRRSVEYAKTI